MAPQRWSSFVAVDPASVRLLHDIRAIAASAPVVLVPGESGGGKEMLPGGYWASAARLLEKRQRYGLA